MKCTNCGNRIFPDTRKFVLVEEEDPEHILYYFCSKKCVKIYCVRKL